MLVLVGYGISLAVSRGHLLLGDGVGRQRRQRRLPRVQRQVNRIVILGQTGHISLEAIRWCLASGVAVVQVDTGGRVGMLATSDGRDDPRLRRAQALASGTPIGLEAARGLIVAKITGQADVLDRHDLSADALGGYAGLADDATTLAELAGIEAQAAARYFNTWTDNLTLRFARDHADRVPAHWARFLNRSSLIHPGPGARDAADPINAMLNYGYALAETECTIALRAVGLDPGLGVLHTDQRARDSLALDLIEPLRPIVDDLILQFITRRVFSDQDFTEDGRGGCRLTPSLASELAGLLPEIARVAAGFAENLAALFASSGTAKINTSASLTRSNWYQAQGLELPKLDAAYVRPHAACEICGQLLAANQKRHCKPCWTKRRQELATEHAIARNAKLADLRAQGRDPRLTKEALTRRSAGVSRSNAERLAWTPTPEEEALTPDWYDNEIQPHLQQFPVRTIQRTLGISNGGASHIRNGRFRPHKRHWLKLKTLIDTTGTGGEKNG